MLSSHLSTLNFLVTGHATPAVVTARARCARPLFRKPRRAAQLQAFPSVLLRPLAGTRRTCSVPSIGACVRCQAVSSPASPEATETEKQLLFAVGAGARMQVILKKNEVTLTTTLPGKLILHWGLQVAGVEGWYLLQDSCHPQGTVPYKDRALQTPFSQADGYSWLRIPLPNEAGLDAINFVIKDAETSAWYNTEDNTNWNIPLIPVLDAPTRKPRKPPPVPKPTSAPGNINVTPTDIPASRSRPTTIPAVDRELQNLWAFRMWEEAGCPNRDGAAQQREFDEGCAQIESLLRNGYLVDELWSCARSTVKGTFPPVPEPPPLPSSGSLNGTKLPPQMPAPINRPEVEQSSAPTDANPLPPPPRAPPTVAKPPPPVPATTPSIPAAAPAEAPAPAPAAQKPAAANIPKLPDAAPDLCGLKAYLMWENAGKPVRSSEEEAREYSRAIELLTQELEEGKTLQEIEAALHAPAPSSSSSPAPSSPAAPPEKTSLWAPGAVVSHGYRDVLSWIESIPDSGGAMPDAGIVNKILDAENNYSEWTLMHRCNLCREVVAQALGFDGATREASLCAIYVWMRFSATRALTWQRNYNTQPRQLSGAQDALSGALADAHGQATTAAERHYIRGILSCTGAGGDGQRIRDDILHIMHRHNIKEQKGTWMEQWHQKLHNNTTPDDVVICEAYIAFLKGDGDNAAYWRVMGEGGVSRERLESFARNITLEPEHFPHCKDALIHDFQEYLRVLKSVHAGTDLGVAARTARNNGLPKSAQVSLEIVMNNRHHMLTAMSAAVECRAAMRSAVLGNRALLYLDLALEDVIRAVAESTVPTLQSLADASQVFALLLENLCLSSPLNQELCVCLADWHKLPDNWWSCRDGALKAVAVVDRVCRALGELSDKMTANLQVQAEYMGGELKEVEDWQTKLFSEEVVRGSAAFAVSLVCTEMDPKLRQVAEMGAWQIISPGKDAKCKGRVVVVDDLSTVQEQVYLEDTVMVCRLVGGDEEIPDGVVACITPNAPDILSHVSVRARNCEVLFATCYDPSIVDGLSGKAGEFVELTRLPSGEVTYASTEAPAAVAAAVAAAPEKKASKVVMQKPRWCKKYAVGMDDMKAGVVGAKSRNLAELRGQLPSWINLPPSVAVPFGSFEALLDHPTNREVKTKLDALYKQVETDLSKLEACREVILGLQAPAELQAALANNTAEAGVPWGTGDDHWDLAFAALKEVWASQYNERAYLSLRKAGLPHTQLCMAVLVQRVVPADYAFVIHTVNPSSGDANEIYIEMVQGLGETLVGNFAGRALAAVVPKNDLDAPLVKSYPSKSTGLFVEETLIFRSDSNGEDLEGYAGAGLYDSIPMHHWEERAVSHNMDPLMQDEELRRQVLSLVARVGFEVENALGTAQDIEGAIEMTSEGPKVTLVQTRPQM